MIRGRGRIDAEQVSQTRYSLGIAEMIRKVLVCDGLGTIKGGLEIVVSFVGVLNDLG